MSEKAKYMATLADAINALESGDKKAREELATKYPLFVTATTKEILNAINHISPRQLERALRGDVVFDYERGRMVKPETIGAPESQGPSKKKVKKEKPVSKTKTAPKKEVEKKKEIAAETDPEDVDEYDDLFEDEE